MSAFQDGRQPLTPFVAATHTPLHISPIIDSELNLLFKHLLRVPDLFADAKNLLNVEYFFPTEKSFAVLWAAMVSLHEEHGRFTDETLRNWILVSTHDCPELFSPADLTKLFRNDDRGARGNCRCSFGM